MVLKKRKAIDIDGHLHLLTFTVYRRAAAFEDARCTQLFMQSLARAREDLGFKLLAYVVMPEHVHLLLQPKSGCKVAEILRAIKQPASNRILRYLEEARPTYSQRFTDLCRRQGEPPVFGKQGEAMIATWYRMRCCATRWTTSIAIPFGAGSARSCINGSFQVLLPIAMRKASRQSPSIGLTENCCKMRSCGVLTLV